MACALDLPLAVAAAGEPPAVVELNRRDVRGDLVHLVHRGPSPCACGWSPATLAPLAWVGSMDAGVPEPGVLAPIDARLSLMLLVRLGAAPRDHAVHRPARDSVSDQEPHPPRRRQRTRRTPLARHPIPLDRDQVRVARVHQPRRAVRVDVVVLCHRANVLWCDDQPPRPVLSGDGRSERLRARLLQHAGRPAPRALPQPGGLPAVRGRSSTGCARLCGRADTVAGRAMPTP